MRTSTSIVSALFAVMSIAVGANAASLTVVADRATYSVGDTITLTVSGTPLATERALGIFGQLNYDQNLVTGIASVQTAMVSTYVTGMAATEVHAPWALGATPVTIAYGTGLAIAFNQIQPTIDLGGTTADPNPDLGLVTLRADAVGTVHIVWGTAPDYQELQFFGLTNAPGTSFNIVGAVPEPTTAPLIGYALVGLIVAGRRRSPRRAGTGEGPGGTTGSA